MKFNKNLSLFILLLILGLIVSESEALVCRNCLSERGLKGCLPIITEGLVQDPVLCLTVTMEQNQSTRSKISATILRLGAGHNSTILGFNLTAYGGERFFNGKCAFMSRKFVRDALPLTNTGGSVRMKVCGCKTDFCNDEKLHQFPSSDDYDGPSKMMKDTCQKPMDKMEEDEQQIFLNESDPFSTPPLWCQTCVSLTGLEGCLPYPNDFYDGKSSLTCVTMTIRYEMKLLGIPLPLETIARFGLGYTFGIVDGGQKCWTVPPQMVVKSDPNSYKLFTVQTCLCRSKGCNCPSGNSEESQEKKETGSWENSLISKCSSSATKTKFWRHQQSNFLLSIFMTVMSIFV